MKKNSLKFNLFIIFFIPSIAFLYFSYLYIQGEYKVQNNAIKYKYSAELIGKLSNLIHNIQLERGLSVGYIVNKEVGLKKRVLEQQKFTDISYKKVLNLIEDEKSFNKCIDRYKNKKLLDEIINNLNNISNIRDNIFNLSASFEQIIKYYTTNNTKLILLIKNINIHFINIHNDPNTINNIIKLKEYAGLERAYSYNQLLNNENYNYLDKINQFKIQQKEIKKEIFFYASKSSIDIYNRLYIKDAEGKLNSCRDGILKKYLTSVDAEKCFSASTEYINMIDSIYTNILQKYVNKANLIFKKSLNSLYMILALWVVSIIAILVVAYILIRLVNREEKYKDDLKIASYTFDAYEGIAITDVYGNIIKVNESFMKITGYTFEEVIGQNPRILKSDMHNKEFYENMWNELVEKGEWQDEIINKRKNGENYYELLSIKAIKNENNITTHYIAQFIDISDIKEAEKKLKYQVDHDFLTNLLNRKSLLERLNEEFTRASRHNFIHAFLFIDLDNFKNINDNYGHNIGDKLIVEIGNRLKSITREEDIVARISGDEFGVVLLNLGSSESEVAKIVKNICIKFLKEISKEIILDGNQLNIGSSIGIKLFPDDEKNAIDVMIHADKAMYEAKKNGKNKFIFFDSKIELELKRFSTIKKEIKKSIKNNEFKFFYQPKIDVKSGKIKGAEMLIRWEHPIKGLLYPDSFIDIAENIDAIHKFSTLALHIACKFIKSNLNIFDGILSLNISSKELLHPNFEDEVIYIISSYKVDPSKIELEITETSIIENFDLVISRILKLQEFGIKFALDDFGKGYSSMTYLLKLPIDTLKIDKEFLIDCSQTSNKELVKMIINIAKILKINVVAEGVETKSQLAFLQENGCKQYQGFYFSKAVPEKEFKQLLLNN